MACTHGIRLCRAGGVSWICAATLLAIAGCGTTRMTDTQRTATEQLLVSNAIDQAVAELDFQALSGKTVYFDPQYLDGTVDRGYLTSALRQQLLACGAVLQEDRAKATYVVEARSGGVGTDRHALLVGIPQMNVPAVVPGQPAQIPEIPIAKKTDQEGVAKIAVFAYNRATGRPVWQSGLVKATSTAKDTWVLGAGPFQRGSIRHGVEFAGEQITVFSEKDPRPDEPAAIVPITQPATWAESPAAKTDSKRLAVLLGAVPVGERQPAAPGSPTAAATPAAPPPKPTLSPVPPNAGGHAESEPSRVVASGLGLGFAPDEP